MKKRLIAAAVVFLLLMKGEFFYPVEEHIKIYSIPVNVLAIILNPYLSNETASDGSTTDNMDLISYTTKYANWYDPHFLIHKIMSDMEEISHNILEYNLVAELEIHEYLEKTDGFTYDENSYTKALLGYTDWHSPDAVNYNKFFENYNLCSIVKNKNIDEIWIYGYTGAGFFEGLSIGDGGFVYGAVTINNLGMEINLVPSSQVGINVNCGKLISVGGFNYAVGSDLVLHDFGHRLEQIMRNIYDWDNDTPDNPWEWFVYNYGKVHFPPNAVTEYDYANKRFVIDNRNENADLINCDEWGCSGDSFMKWWFYHIPFEWWYYFINPASVYE